VAYRVGVDDRASQPGELRRRDALSGADAARKPDDGFLLRAPNKMSL